MPENTPKNDTDRFKTALGQYSLKKKIAQGGMAEIYKGLAMDIHGTQRTVVIKKILPHIAANREFVDMLVSEAKIAVQLSHGNIAQIYDLGRAGSDYFMVMEFVDGKSLSQIHKKSLKEGHLIPLDHLCYFISEVANGLDYMHGKKDEAGDPLNIVHRDISPQNIIISHSGTVKIIDFGIAKAATKIDKTESGILKGKFAYMSPEQARGENIDNRSDIFSLGVIFHEMACGRRLFKDKDNKATIRNVRRADILPPSKFKADLPKEIDDIAMKALVKDPEHRYQNAGEMRDDLVRFLHTYYPDYQPSSIAKLIEGLFGQDDVNEEEEEMTPLLIVDQTQAAIQLDPSSVLNKFMIFDDAAKDVKDEPKEPLVDDEPKAPGPTIKDRLKKIWPVIKTAGVSISIIGVIAAMGFAGYKYNVLGLWSDFLNPVTIDKEKPEAGQPVVEKMTLVIGSEPSGASVFIDNVDTGRKTPVTLSDQVADNKAHTVGLFLPDHNYFEAPFTAMPGGNIMFKPIMQRSLGELKAYSFPSEARVYLNGELAGTTPFEKKGIPPKTIYKVMFEKDGYISVEDTVQIAPLKTTSVRASLMKDPKKKEEPIAPPPSPEPAVEPPVAQQPVAQPQDGVNLTSPSPAKAELPKQDGVTEVQEPLAGKIEVTEEDLPEMPKLLPPAQIGADKKEPELEGTTGPTPESRKAPMELDYSN